MEFPKDTDHCFMFELLSTKHSIIVRHKRNDIILVGVRDLKSFRECEICSFQSKYKTWQIAKKLEIKHHWNLFEDLLPLMFGKDPTEFEGFVICDSNFNRVKLKSTQYVSLSHLKQKKTASANSLIKLVQIVINNEGSEFLSYFPDFRNAYEQLDKKLHVLLDFVLNFFEKNKKRISEEKKALELIKDFTTHPLLRQLMLNVWKQTIQNLKQEKKENDLNDFEIEQITRKVIASNQAQDILTMMNAAQKITTQNEKTEMLEENQTQTKQKRKNKEKQQKNNSVSELPLLENQFDLLSEEA
jgi:hypothetical protein